MSFRDNAETDYEEGNAGTYGEAYRSVIGNNYFFSAFKAGMLSNHHVLLMKS